jgi:hypothetical protein
MAAEPRAGPRCDRARAGPSMHPEPAVRISTTCVQRTQPARAQGCAAGRPCPNRPSAQRTSAVRGRVGWPVPSGHGGVRNPGLRTPVEGEGGAGPIWRAVRRAGGVKRRMFVPAALMRSTPARPSDPLPGRRAVQGPERVWRPAFVLTPPLPRPARSAPRLRAVPRALPAIRPQPGLSVG